MHQQTSCVLPLSITVTSRITLGGLSFEKSHSGENLWYFCSRVEQRKALHLGIVRFLVRSVHFESWFSAEHFRATLRGVGREVHFELWYIPGDYNFLSYEMLKIQIHRLNLSRKAKVCAFSLSCSVCQYDCGSEDASLEDSLKVGSSECVHWSERK